MRIWVQVFSSKEKNPHYHAALLEHLQSVVEPGVEVEVHGTRQGGLGEQFRFFQSTDMRDIIDSILQCRNAKGADRYDAFVSLNHTDPGLYEAREILEIPVLGFLETTSLISCMMGRSFSLITPNAKFALSSAQKIKLYGLSERLVSIESLSFEHLPNFWAANIDPALRKVVTDAFDVAAKRAVAAGAEVIIPCGSHSVIQAQRGIKEVDGALVLDGLAVLIKMAETAVKIQQITGSFVSRKLLYQMPGKEIREKAKQAYGIDLS